MSLLSDVCPTCKRRRQRSVPQNSRYWKLLTIASEKLGHSKETWHAYMTDKFLPRKIVVICGEEKVIRHSTHDLPMHPDPKNPDSPNWDNYTMEVEAFLAEHGVYLPE